MARRPVQDRSEEKRDRILDAVLELVAERGLAGVSHRAVAERAGVTLSATSYYFESKAELERAAIEAHYQRRLEDYAAIADAVTAAEASPEALIEAAVELFTASDTSMLLGHFEVYVNAARRPDLRILIGTTFDAMRELLTRALAPLDLPDVAAAVTAVTAIIEGIELRRLAEGIDGREELRQSLRLLLRGLLADSASRSTP